MSCDNGTGNCDGKCGGCSHNTPNNEYDAREAARAVAESRPQKIEELQRQLNACWERNHILRKSESTARNQARDSEGRLEAALNLKARIVAINKAQELQIMVLEDKAKQLDNIYARISHLATNGRIPGFLWCEDKNVQDQALSLIRFLMLRCESAGVRSLVEDLEDKLSCRTCPHCDNKGVIEDPSGKYFTICFDCGSHADRSTVLEES